ncbi:hypothetical protein EMCRGX_G000278 [Ephydatia muelleri]
MPAWEQKINVKLDAVAANSDFGKPTNTDDSIDLETELVCDPLSVSFEGELAGDTHKLAKNSDELETDDVALAKIKDVEFQGINLPPAVQKRGRPKGHEATVIGLPQKGHTLRNKPKPFCELHTSEEIIMLMWLVKMDVVALIHSNEWSKKMK